MFDTPEAELDRYWELEIDEANIKHLRKWIKGDVLVALVDEENGGIIGYLNRAHSTTILNKLNKET